MKSVFLTALISIGVLVGCNSGATAEAAPAPQVKKNVILIYADDLGWGQVGFNGQKKIIAPNLDQCAKVGMNFTNFYTSAPFCPPARNSLMTGLDTGETVWRVKDMQFGREATMAQMFRDNGYDTSMFGKWGMSTPKTSASESHAYKLTCSNMDQFYSTLSYEFERMGDPVDAGFGTFVGYMDHRDAHVSYHDSPDTPEEGTPDHPYNANVIRQDLFRIKGSDVVRYPTTKDDYLPDLMMHEAKQHLRNVVAEGKNFFMYLPSQLPHAELVTPPHYEGLYTDGSGKSIFPETEFFGNEIFFRHVKEPRATLARMITRLDAQVGWIVDELKRLGVYDNTIIVFTSDNGHHTAGGIGTVDYFDSNGGMRGQKWELHEGGIKVPMLVFGGGVPHGTEATRYTQYQLKDTFEEMLTGGSEPRSFYDSFYGNTVPQQDYLYFQFMHDQTTYTVSDTRQAVIKGDWKMVRYGKQNPYFRLYDLNERYEANNKMSSNCMLSQELVSYLNDRLDDGLPKGVIYCD